MWNPGRRRWHSFDSKTRRRIRNLLKARQGDRCALCGFTGPLTVDHIMPQHAGGTSELFNLRLLCVRCNQARSCHGVTP